MRKWLGKGPAWQPKVVALTDAATIAVNADQVDVGTVTLGGNRTLGNPTGTPVDGQELWYRVKQDATGGRTLAVGTAFKLSADIPVFSIGTNPNEYTYIKTMYNGASTKFDIVAINRGF